MLTIEFTIDGSAMSGTGWLSLDGIVHLDIDGVKHDVDVFGFDCAHSIKRAIVRVYPDADYIRVSDYLPAGWNG